MKRLSIIALGLNSSQIASAAEPQQDTIIDNPYRMAFSQRPRWETPRNDEKWQGRGKRRKPKLK